MIPDFVNIKGVAYGLLPPGIHLATRDEVQARYGYNPQRQRLFYGFVRGATDLFQCGCSHLFLNGSFITQKELPDDFDCCWDEKGVNAGLLDLVLMDFDNKQRAQKEKYFGEFFPANNFAKDKAASFLQLFQRDKSTGQPKGILRINSWVQ